MYFVIMDGDKNIHIIVKATTLHELELKICDRMPQIMDQGECAEFESSFDDERVLRFDQDQVIVSLLDENAEIVDTHLVFVQRVNVY